MSRAQDITSAFGGNWHGTYGSIPTPGHSAKDRGTTVKDTGDGGVVFNSFNGGDWRALKEECERRGLLPDREDRIPQWRVTGTYEYADESGEIRYRTTRKEKDGEKKRFVAERLVNGRWDMGLGDTARVPYRLPDLIAADPGETVFFAEGERKADKLAQMGFVATAIAFGCKGWRDDYARHFAGRKVAILPDNDDKGRAFAEKVRTSIEKAGGTPFVVELPGLPPGGDVINWTGTPEELRALAVAAAAGPPEQLLPYFDAGDFEGVAIKPREFMTAGLEPKGSATYLTGIGASGKSLLTQQRLTCSAAGLPFLGVDTCPGVSIYISCEDSLEELHRRQESINEALGLAWSDLRGRLFLVSLKGQINNELCTFTSDGRMSVTDRWRELIATIKAIGATHVGLDNVAHLFAGDENNRHQVASFVGLLDRLAQDIEGGVLFLGHPNKSGDEFSGSTAWENQVRARLYLSLGEEDANGVADPDARRLTNSKPNYSRRGEAIDFMWFKWAFVKAEDVPPSVFKENAANVQAHAENDRFLECLAKATEEKRATSSSSSASNYAPRLFAKMPTARKMKLKSFAAAMERLLHLGVIQGNQQVYKRDNRAWVMGLGLVDKSAPTLRTNHAPTGCTNPHTDEAETRRNPCTEVHAHVPYSTTYNRGAAYGAAAPPDDVEFPDEEAAE